MHLKVYRRDNRKKDEGRWRRAFLRASGVLGVVLLGLVAYRVSGPVTIAVISLREFILDSPYFSVREIQVCRADRASGQEAVAMAGLRRRMSISSIDLTAIQRKISRHDW